MRLLVVINLILYDSPDLVEGQILPDLAELRTTMPFPFTGRTTRTPIKLTADS
jgi:hypothetical protein